MKPKIHSIITLFITLFLLNNCGFYKPTDARKVSPDPRDRVKRNLEEGRGLRLSSLGTNKNTNFQFASSNPLWRASLDVLNFAPLINANYSGGIIITDWVSNDDQNLNEYFKISIQFLSNEIRSDAIKVSLYEKKCNNNNQCKVSEIRSDSVEKEISKKILKIAALYEQEDFEKLKKELGEYKGLKN